MNTLKIKINPYSDENTASLDDKALSPYSELNNYIKEPFLEWAYKLMGAAERELNDDFNLVVVGGGFEANFIQGMQNDNDSCLSYSVEPFQIATPVSERLQSVLSYADKYHIDNLEKVKISAFDPYSFIQNTEHVSKVEKNIAFLAIMNSVEEALHVAEANNIKIVIVPGETNHVTITENKQYVWEVPADEVGEMIEIVIDRFAKIPTLIGIINEIQSVCVAIDPEDKKAIELSYAIDGYIYVDHLSDIEVGKRIDLCIHSIPEDIPLPSLRIISSNDEVIRIENFSVCAVAPGKSNIEFFREGELSPFYTQEIKSISNNFVENISLSSESNEMGIGKTQSLKVEFLPGDAEDIDSLILESSNNEIISITDNNELLAKAPGSATITAKTTRAKSNIDINVLPNLSEVSLSVNSAELFVGQTMKIEIHTKPAKCFNSEVVWETTDKSVAIIDALDNGEQIIRATGIGDCVVTFKAKEGAAQASCSVRVESTLNRKENKHTFLSLTTVFAVICVFCSFLGTLPVALVSAAFTLVFAIISCVKHKGDIFWALLLAVLAIVFVMIKAPDLIQKLINGGLL